MLQWLHKYWKLKTIVLQVLAVAFDAANPSWWTTRNISRFEQFGWHGRIRVRLIWSYPRLLHTPEMRHLVEIMVVMMCILHDCKKRFLNTLDWHWLALGRCWSGVTIGGGIAYGGRGRCWRGVRGFRGWCCLLLFLVVLLLLLFVGLLDPGAVWMAVWTFLLFCTCAVWGTT